MSIYVIADKLIVLHVFYLFGGDELDKTIKIKRVKMFLHVINNNCMKIIEGVEE